MKKLFIILLLMFCFGLTACKKDDVKKLPDEENKGTVNVYEEVPKQKEEVIENKEKVTENNEEEPITETNEGSTSDGSPVEEKPVDRVLEIKDLIEAMKAEENAETVIRTLFKLKQEIESLTLEDKEKITNFDQIEILLEEAIAKKSTEMKVTDYVVDGAKYHTYEELLLARYGTLDVISEVLFMGPLDSSPRLGKTPEEAARMFYLPFIKVKDESAYENTDLIDKTLLFADDEYKLAGVTHFRFTDSDASLRGNFAFHFYSNGICILRMRANDELPWELYVSIIKMDQEVYAQESHVPFESFFPTI